MKLTHKFIKNVPEVLENGMIYISIDYATAIHKCCCGCGREVVTPFSPTDWKLSFDGETISLSPSIGNWSFKCQSHYWVTNNQIVWAPKWTEKQIKQNTQWDQNNKMGYYGTGSDKKGIFYKLFYGLKNKKN